MEGPKNINSNGAICIQTKRTANAVRLIIIFHLVGLIGLSAAITRPIFLHLVPFHLLLMMLILFFSHDSFGAKFLFFFGTIFIIGFAVEWAGVHTGQLFGSYTYGETLGLSIDGIPIIMGINWFLLTYTVGVSLQHIRIPSIWARVIAGAALMVLLDVVIEPVAIKFNYWHWTGNTIPFTNYVCWFIISAALVFIFETCRFKKQSIVGVVLLISQFIFFISLLSESQI